MQECTVADLGFWKGGFQCARDCSHKAREARARSVWHARGDMSPQEDFWFRTFWDRFWCRFGVKQQELDDQLPNLVIVFEALARFKGMAPLRSAEAAKQPWGAGKLFLASYCIRSVVALWSWEIQILTVYHRIVSYLLWYLIMVSVGCSVRSYVCGCILTKYTRRQPFKRGVHLHPPYPPWIRHWCTG